MHANNTIKTTNNFAGSYDNYIKDCQWVGTDIMFGLMYEFLSPEQILLDIGIGTGLASLLFHKYGLKIYGIDGSEEMISVCKSKGFVEEFKRINFTDESVWFKNKTFDHIISHGVFNLVGDLQHIFNNSFKSHTNKGVFCFTYEGLRDSSDGYLESKIPGIYQKKIKESGIRVYRHTSEYIFEQLKITGFKMLKTTEFLAFIDSETKAKTYFTIVLAINANQGLKLDNIFSM